MGPSPARGSSAYDEIPSGKFASHDLARLCRPNRRHQAIATTIVKRPSAELPTNAEHHDIQPASPD